MVLDFSYPSGFNFLRLGRVAKCANYYKMIFWEGWRYGNPHSFHAFPQSPAFPKISPQHRIHIYIKITPLLGLVAMRWLGRWEGRWAKPRRRRSALQQRFAIAQMAVKLMQLISSAAAPAEYPTRPAASPRDKYTFP